MALKFIECPVSAEQAVKLIVEHPGHQLQFARRGEGGRVHILRPWPEKGMTSDPDLLTCSGLFIPWGVLGWSLCGQRMTLHSQRGYRVSTFKDADLCWSCHALLGDEKTQARCFDSLRPEEL